MAHGRVAFYMNLQALYVSVSKLEKYPLICTGDLVDDPSLVSVFAGSGSGSVFCGLRKRKRTCTTTHHREHALAHTYSTMRCSLLFVT
jgi:hypothetical protein